MITRWIIVADSNRARLFQTEDGLDDLTELADFLNPAGRLDGRELRKDAFGRFYRRGERDQSGTAEPPVSTSEHHEENFSRAITRYLKQGHDDHLYDELSIVAAPAFLGLLRKQLSEQLSPCIKQELSKEISGLSTTEIKRYLRTNLV